MAPMVRGSTLPLRELAFDYGCNLVYSEELIDLAVIPTTRSVRSKTTADGRTVDLVEYRAKHGRAIFSTTTTHGPCVFQLGTSKAATALQAAQHVINDVAGVDVNMGCPKSFSVDGGMGVALMSKPDDVVDILKTLRSNMPANKSVTCKIRILPTVAETLQFCKMVESCGITALAVHGRTKDQRDEHKANWATIKLLAEDLAIPVILNGDVFSYEDFARARAETGVTGVMCARAALANPSVFRAAGPLPVHVVARSFLDKCVDYDCHFVSAKWSVTRMLGGVSRKPPRQLKALHDAANTSKDYNGLRKLFEADANAVASELVSEAQTKRPRLTVDSGD